MAEEDRSTDKTTDFHGRREIERTNDGPKTRGNPLPLYLFSRAGSRRAIRPASHYAPSRAHMLSQSSPFPLILSLGNKSHGFNFVPNISLAPIFGDHAPVDGVSKRGGRGFEMSRGLLFPEKHTYKGCQPTVSRFSGRVCPRDERRTPSPRVPCLVCVVEPCNDVECHSPFCARVLFSDGASSPVRTAQDAPGLD